MDILAKARQIESNIARRLDRAAKDFVQARARDPLEIAHAVVDAVEEQIQPSGRGTRLFPFTHVAVTVAASTDDARARCEALFAASPTLRERIAERLAAAGCSEIPPAVLVEYVPRPHKNWRHQDFDIRFSRVSRPARPPVAEAPPPARIDFVVLCGVAERPEYSFGSTRIDIGRCREVRDNRHRLIRANDVAFADSADAVNSTVSRRHAHIVFDETARGYRLRDDGSAHGTAVVREGRTITVPCGTRGVRLKVGDEIVLGEARMRVQSVAASSPD
jgi:hypothetical protein